MTGPSRRQRKNGRGSERVLLLVLAALAAGATILVYGHVAGFEFITSDDGVYVTENPAVRAGLTGSGLRWAFGIHESNWHPLTWLSLMLDAEIGGLDPGVFHVTNLVLHVANTLLLLWVLFRMTGAKWRAGLVALLFGIHPLHVESVAWVAERKDVLSTFFWLLTLAAYVGYTRNAVPSRYAWVLSSFAAGLLCKPMLVTLPLTLLLIDFWPLGRWTGSGTVRRQLILEKLPLFALSTISAAVTLHAQSAGGAVGSLRAFPVLVRAGNAAVTYVVYIVKTLWPSRLAFFYPHPGEGLNPWVAIGSAALLAGVTAATLRVARRFPYVTWGWLWYIITLIPVIGIVQVGIQARADRYTYVPSIGLFVIVAWSAADLIASRRSVAQVRHLRNVFVVAFAAAAVALLWMARVQAEYWRNSVALYEHALRVTKDNAVAHDSLGLALLQRGDLDGAISHCREALRIAPWHPEAPNHLATALATKGRLDEAMATYQEALKLRPHDPTLHSNFGALLAQQGLLEAATSHLREAMRLAPTLPDAHNNMGVLLARLGRYDEAIAEFLTAQRLSPLDEEIRANLELARTLRRNGGSK